MLGRGLGVAVLVGGCSLASLDDLNAGTASGNGGSAPSGTVVSSGGSPTGSGAGGSGGCACIEDVDKSWVGPSFLFTTPAADTFACPGGTPSVYWEGPPAPKFDCVPCGCRLPSAASCSQNPIECYSGSTCTGSLAGTFTPDGCAVTNLPPSCKVGGSSLTGGACASTGGVPESLQGWETAHHLCSPEAAGPACPGGSCVVPPPGVTHVCVVGGRGALCPPDWDDLVIDAFGGDNDDRSCSPCTCSAPMGTCVGGEYEVSANPAGCGFASKVTEGQCFAGGTKYVNFAGGAMPGPATCTPTTASAPTGSFTPTDPVSICCRQLP